jgi:hypothetical protein
MGVLTTEQRQQANRAAKRRQARGVTVDGIRFDDRRQANLFVELKALQRSGTITDLKVHSRLPLVVKGIRVDTYTALFTYKRDGQVVLVDTSRWQTDVRKLQQRLVEAIYGITVTEG